MTPSPRIRRRLAGCILACLLALAVPAALQARRHAPRSEAGAFDYYLLSLSVAPSFCALSPANQGRFECRTLDDAAYRQTPLTVHGLWPNRAFVSVNQQPQHCDGPPLTGFAPDLRASLRRYMPAGPGLARHEWERHGVCSGLPPDRYFATLVHLAEDANNVIGGVLRDGGLLGHRVRIADLLAAIANRNPALAQSVVVSCRFPRGSARSDQALIEEIRIILSKDFTPIPSTSVGLRQNSGCPQGAGFLPG